MRSLSLPTGAGWLGLVCAGGEDPAAALLAMNASMMARGEPLAVVDAGNRFDPSRLVRAAQWMRTDPSELLSRVFISRSFTCHQTVALVAEELPGFLQQRRIRSVLALGLCDTFLDEAMPQREAERLFERTVRALHELATAGTRILCAEADLRGVDGRPARLWKQLQGESDFAAQLEGDDRQWRMAPLEETRGPDPAHLH